jgi:hypothetical protein
VTTSLRKVTPFGLEAVDLGLQAGYHEVDAPGDSGERRHGDHP